MTVPPSYTNSGEDMAVIACSVTDINDGITFDEDFATKKRTMWDGTKNFTSGTTYSDECVFTVSLLYQQHWFGNIMHTFGRINRESPWFVVHVAQTYRELFCLFSL